MANIATSVSLQLSNPFPRSSLKPQLHSHKPLPLFITRAKCEGEVRKMANMATSVLLQLSNKLPLSSSSSLKPQLHSHKPLPLFITRAAEPESDAAQPESDDFDERINQFRLRYKSGTGKKADLRKGRKSKRSSGSGVYLAPVPLKEAVSEGLKVDLGFSQYSERLNGRIAALGLVALFLVELATGKGVIKYHTPAIVLIQIYFVAAVSALYVKYQKEKISVWPPPSN